MNKLNKKNRIGLATIGILSVLVGIWMLFNPVKTIISMTWIFGLLILVAGIFELAVWNDLRKAEIRKYTVLINGILNILLSILLFFTQAYSLILLGVIFAVIFLIDSISWFDLAKYSNYPKLNMVLNFIGIILGVILLFSPVYSLTVLFYTVVYVLIAYGILTFIKVF